MTTTTGRLSTGRPTASQRITAEVTSWPGVEAGPGRRGEFAFTVGRRRLGHLHGDRAAHFSFPQAVWAEPRTPSSHHIWSRFIGSATQVMTNEIMPHHPSTAVWAVIRAP